MVKRNLITILVLALCISISFSLSSFADTGIVSEPESFRITADDEALKILNELDGTDISYGELITKVYPEIVKYIPVDLLEYMYNEKVKKVNPYSGPLADKSDNYIDPLADIPGLLAFTSTLTAGSGNLYYSSTTQVVFPYVPFPNLLALSQLRAEDGTILAEVIESLDNTYAVMASNYFYSPVQGRKYYVTGTHFAKSPPNVTPPYISGYSSTPLLTY